MKYKILEKTQRGITLIALVITIIVLLILAGVAISMLSGENGILRKAGEAKTKTEEAQKEESTALLDMEIDSYFITNNLKYKCRYGYVTGIQPGTTVEVLKQELPSGYSLKAIDGTDTFTAKNNNGELIVTTGLQIVNNEGKEVARTVIFGDTNCDGVLNIFDVDEIGNCEGNKEKYPAYQMAAMDINQDGYIDESDRKELQDYAANLIEDIQQNVYASKLKTITRIPVIDVLKKIKIYEENSIKKADEKDWDVGEYYTLKLNKEYTYKELTEKIKETYPDITVKYTDNTDDRATISNTSEDKVQTENWLIIVFPPKIENDTMPEKLSININFK